MVSAEQNSATGEHSRSGLIWYYVYLLLGVLNVAVLCVSLILTHRVNSLFTLGVQDNRSWLERIALYSQLSYLATQIDSPGNDIFESQNPDLERKRIDKALNDFNTAWVAAKKDIQLITSDDQITSLFLTQGLDELKLDVDEMSEISSRIFAMYEEGNITASSAEMSSLDRKFAHFLQRSQDLKNYITQLMYAQLESARQEAGAFTGIGVALISLTVVLLFCGIVYGSYLHKSTSRDERRRLARELDTQTQKLKVAKETAENANAAKGNFLAIMSHEIRTPLTSVLGMLELLLEGNLEPEQRKLGNTARESADALATIVNDVLDFSKIEANKLKLVPEKFSLRGLMDQLERIFLLKVEQKGISYLWECDSEVPDLLIQDPVRLRQILTNLVGNSVKFTPNGGGILLRIDKVTSDSKNAVVRFRLSDSGIGIPADRLDSIFTPYEQASAGTSVKFGGTGLGLAICSMLADIMGGEISVESKEGVGTCFSFTINCEVARENTQQNSTSDPEPLPAKSQPLRILLVEDYKINQMLAATHLQRDGHSVMIAENGREALEKTDAEPFDLILMDMYMPEMGGEEATRIIRSRHGAAGQVPIVVLTGSVLNEDREKFQKLGIHGFITKPYRKSDLIKTVQGLALA